MSAVALDADSRKRPLRSPENVSERPTKDRRRDFQQSEPRGEHTEGARNTTVESHPKRDRQSFAREQTRLNQIQEAEQMREWVAKEDDFVLKQSKKKAHIRVREGRARTIDWLAVTLGVVDGTRDPLEDDEEELDVEVIDPSGVFEGLSLTQLQDLLRDIGNYLVLEKDARNRKYWKALEIICKDYQDKLEPTTTRVNGRSVSSVSADVDRLLAPKSLEELEGLEKQIKTKLRSDEPIDVDYWEHLLKSVAVYKSRNELNMVYKTIIQNRLDELRKEEGAEAADIKHRFGHLLGSLQSPESTSSLIEPDKSRGPRMVQYSAELDPEPMLRLRQEDKSLELVDEDDFISKIALERRRVQKLAYVPLKQAQSHRIKSNGNPKSSDTATADPTRFAPLTSEDFSSATTALYEREVARGVQENEEIFAGEEEVVSKTKPQWANKYRPRKPRYFNRVQMGYEWNKYNQTHYDHDNPPPKVVQGYKFNIFYPDLIDKSRAPTYRIERENGRKRGETSAAAGDEDTCLIRFVSGPPYEDIAFRILDKKWDLSAQRDRGFRSSFDKGILQLHFQFKKVFYRK